MRLAKKRLRISSKSILIVIVIAIVVWIIFFSGFVKKNCKQDKDCFVKAANECKPSKFINVKSNNIYDYVILGSERDNCVLHVKLRRMAIGMPLDIVSKLEGKDMKCKIPKNKMENIEDVQALVNYCSGPLKEGIYEIIIERLYGLILKNMGGIIDEASKKIYGI